MTAKRGLGKGLGALIPSAPMSDADLAPDQTAPSRTATHTQGSEEPAAHEPAAVYAELPIASISPNPRQPRTVFDDEALAELVFSISEIGLLQPVVVRPLGEDRYELVAGERRWRACTKAGLTVIPAIIRETDDDDLLRDALLENLHRANLNALEEAAAYQQLLEDFGCTQEDLATRIGRSRPQVTNTLRLLQLPPDVQRRVAAGVLSAGHARALLSLSDPDSMSAMATRIVNEGLSVRSVEEIIHLGGGGQRKSKGRSKKATTDVTPLADAVAELAEVAGDALDTRCSTTGFGSKKAKGKLVIECADVADLRRIVEALSQS